MMQWLDPQFLITTFGLIGVVAIIFAESGLLIGFFFPGDSLIFTAGLFASQGYFNIVLLLTLCSVAAVVGDNVGYAFGRRVGPSLFSRPKSKLFNPEHMLTAEKFYQEHGSKAIILARFMPVVRTFAPIVAGIGKMNYSTFITYNIIGGALWVFGMGGLGYTLGATVPNIDRYILPIIGVIVLTSILPPLIHLYKQRKAR